MPGVRQTMHEFKRGKLHSGSKNGPLVKSRKQAIAIAMNEGGVKKVGQANSNPSETRESGDDLVPIGDGGGPFQKYGPAAGEADPCELYSRQRENFSMEVPDKIERLKPYPRRQVVDDGGNS